MEKCRFRGQDSSSCCTRLGGRDLERLTNAEKVVVATGRAALQKLLVEETDSGIWALVAEDRIRRTVLAGVALAVPPKELGNLLDSCWCDGAHYVEAVRSSPSLCLAIAEECLQATGVGLVVHVV